uniref:hypothetical protein n=1 Tax=Paenibacillus sp. FSL M8-0142 TaxID=2954525 RepID=UPI00406C8501
MMDVQLVRPSTKYKEEYLSFYQEWLESNEVIVPWVITKDPRDFEGMLHFLLNNEEGIEPRKVGLGIPLTGWLPKQIELWEL